MYTRCPQCDTVYRVTPQQLQASSGEVRCGRCEAVFDAFSSLSSMPPARGAMRQEIDEQLEALAIELAAEHTPESAAPDAVPAGPMPPASGPPMTASPEASSVPPAASPLTASSKWVVSSTLDAPSIASSKAGAAVSGGLEPESLTLPDELFEPGWMSPARRAAWLAANALLLGLLAGQAAWHFATPIATYAPALAPALEAYCQRAGCRFGLPRVPEQLFIEASDLQLLDAARPGQVLLTATIRNRAMHAQALPLLELTLTAAHSQTAARRVFTPAEYLDAERDAGANHRANPGASPEADPGTDFSRGIGAQQEVSIRLYLDIAELRATGYRLYLFFA